MKTDAENSAPSAVPPAVAAAALDTFGGGKPIPPTVTAYIDSIADAKAAGYAYHLLDFLAGVDKTTDPDQDGYDSVPAEERTKIRGEIQRLMQDPPPAESADAPAMPAAVVAYIDGLGTQNAIDYGNAAYDWMARGSNRGELLHPDDPSVEFGLDAETRKVIWDQVAKLSEEAKAILPAATETVQVDQVGDTVETQVEIPAAAVPAIDGAESPLMEQAHAEAAIDSAANGVAPPAADDPDEPGQAEPDTEGAEGDQAHAGDE